MIHAFGNVRRRRQLRRRRRRLPDPRRDPVRGHHQRRRPRRRSRRALHPRRHARQADGDRRRPERRPDHRRARRASRRDDDRSARPTSTARWTAPRSSSRATPSPASSSSSINIVGGIAIGVLQQRHGLRRRAVSTYTLLTDRRRPGRADPGAADLDRRRHHRHPRRRASTNLGSDARRRRSARSPRRAVHRRRRARPRSASCPGLPKLPFLLHRRLHPRLVAHAAASARSRRSARAEGRRGGRRAAPRRRRSPRTSPPAAARPARARDRLRPDPARRRATRAATCSSASRMVRRQMAIGARPRRSPPIRIRDNVQLGSHEYAVKHQRRRGGARRSSLPGQPAGDEPGRPPTRRRSSGIPTIEPAFGLPAVWIAESASASRPRPRATPSSTRVARSSRTSREVIRRNAAELLGRQDVAHAARPPQGAAARRRSTSSCPT